MGAIAATRFGLGARPGEIEDAARDPFGWALAQIEPGAAPAWIGLPHSSELIDEARRLEAEQPVAALRRPWFETTIRREHLHRVVHACTTEAPFRERWAMFWRNHFAVKIDAPYLDLIAPAYAREAIDPHLFGRFEDMALAAERHPAMLFALDAASSVGPDSPFGRAAGRGLNENLAREMLELHTLGVHGGYRQADVTELAKVLTGWSVGDPGTARAGRFVDIADRRQPGARRVLGRVWPEAEDRSEQVVRALARHPATAAHLATKLAAHFTADRPPAALAARLRASFLESEGDLRRLAEVLVRSPEAWVREQGKFKTPAEFVVSVHRAAGVLPEEPFDAVLGVQAMGHMWMTSRTAEGWSDDASAWATPQGLAIRAHYAWTHAHKGAARDSREFARQSLSRLARRGTTATAAGGAGGDRASAFALIAMSPEFQRR